MIAASWLVLGESEVASLSLAGGLIMAVSVVAVLSLVSFCLYRVLTLPPVEVTDHLKGPLDIDTHDTWDAD